MSEWHPKDGDAPYVHMIGAASFSRPLTLDEYAALEWQFDISSGEFVYVNLPDGVTVRKML